MSEIKSADLNEIDRFILFRAAEIMKRLEKEHPGDVMFDSCGNYYVSCEDIAQRFYLLVQS